jgi:hypothetical protein
MQGLLITVLPGLVPAAAEGGGSQERNEQQQQEEKACKGAAAAPAGAEVGPLQHPFFARV